MRRVPAAEGRGARGGKTHHVHKKVGLEAHAADAVDVGRDACGIGIKPGSLWSALGEDVKRRRAGEQQPSAGQAAERQSASGGGVGSEA